MRVLDLGCGKGISLTELGVSDTDDVVGVDIDPEDLDVARIRFPHRTFVLGKGEDLSFLEADSVERVIAEVSVPYMDIPRVLEELYRVLKPGGSLFLSLHSYEFTLRELRRTAFPKPIPTAYRLYVLANGMWFHWTGRTLRFSEKRVESFQTERGMRKALARAGYNQLEFTRSDPRFIVRAVRM